MDLSAFHTSRARQLCLESLLLFKKNKVSTVRKSTYFIVNSDGREFCHPVICPFTWGPKEHFLRYSADYDRACVWRKKKKTCIQNNFVFKPCNHSSYSFVKPWLGTLEDLYVIMPCTALWGTARACTLGINLPTFWIPGSGCVVWACFVCLTSINTLGAARSCSLVFQHIHYSQFLHIPTPSQKGVRQNFISTVMTMTPDKLLQNQTSRLFYF